MSDPSETSSQEPTKSPAFTLHPDTRVVLSPRLVEYRLSTGYGIRVVKVFLDVRENPKILAETEVYRRPKRSDDLGVEFNPMPLSFHEVLGYISDALKRLG